MAAVRRFARVEWEIRLQRVHCEPLPGKTKLNTAEWWRTRWNWVFTVPVDPDDCVTEADLQATIAEIVASAPQGYSFEDN